MNSGIEVSLKELIDLRRQVVYQSKLHKKKWATLAGQKQTSIRGRGMEFDTTREYQAGDDIRNMAWRVTARSLKPYVKIYHEERERPIWLGVDLSPSQFFGTRSMFKSACSIKKAAIIGWSHLQAREKIGAVIAGRDKTISHKPHAGERNFSMILNSLATSSMQQQEFTEKNYLHNLLLKLDQQINTGSLVFVLSDFFKFDISNQKLLLHIAQRAHLTLIFVYDAFEVELPPPHQYIVTDGKQKALFNMNNKGCRMEFQKQFQTKLQQLTSFTRRYNIKLQLLRTDQM